MGWWGRSYSPGRIYRDTTVGMDEHGSELVSKTEKRQGGMVPRAWFSEPSLRKKTPPRSSFESQTPGDHIGLQVQDLFQLNLIATLSRWHRLRIADNLASAKA